MARIVRLSIQVVLVSLLTAAVQGRGTVPDLQVDALASGPYSEMHMLLEKSVFNLDVLTVDLRFDQATQQRFRRLANGQPFSAHLVGEIADAAVDADQVFAKLEFRRDVSLNRWMEAVRDSLRRAWQAGLIEEQTYRNTSENLPHWFRAIAERGFKQGDQILYRGYPDKLRTVLAAETGEVLLDQTDPGSSPRRALLAGYFAPGTDFREPLVRSLLQQ
jgi:hypothetical protein